MSNSTQLKCQIPTPLYNRLQVEADREGLTIRQRIIAMLVRELDELEAKAMLFAALESDHG